MELSTIWPGWETIRVIGSGGFGKVYEIRKKDVSGEYRSALKVISIPQSEDEYKMLEDDGYDEASITSIFESQVEDVVKEFRVMAQFKGNSNIVSYEDHMTVPHDDGKGWDILIRMELLTSLPEHLKKQTIKEEDVIRLGIDICSALELCADKNIIHRDVKPQNIFVNDFGNYKLGDFGIARMIDHTTVVSKAFSPDYVSPELYSGRPVSAASDIYSLALVMYWLLNERRLPFMPLPPAVPRHTELESAKQRRLSGEPVPEPENGSAELKRIILKALTFSPEDRYDTASDMKAELQEILGRNDKKQKRSLQHDQIIRVWYICPKCGMRYEREGTEKNLPSFSHCYKCGWDINELHDGEKESITSNKQNHPAQNKYFVRGGDLSQQDEIYKGMKETQNDPYESYDPYDSPEQPQRSNYGWDNAGFNTGENQTVKVNRVPEAYKEYLQENQYPEDNGVSAVEDPGNAWKGSEPANKSERAILIILIAALAAMLCMVLFILSQRGCGGSAADEPAARSESNVESEGDESAARSESDVENKDSDKEVKAESGSDAQEENEAQAAEESADADADSSDKTSADISENPAAKKYLEPEKANQTITEKGGYNGRYYVDTYDVRGAITETSCYLWDDTLEYCTIYQRDENGAPLHFDRYSDEDLLTEYCNYTLDSNGFVESMKIYDEEDTLTQESNYTNDAEGNRLTEEYKGKNYYIYNEYELDEYGNSVKSEEYDKKRNLTRTAEYEYRDPENGTLLKTTYYNPDGSLQSVSEYNEDGEEIHYIYYSSYDKGSYQERKTDYSEEGLVTGSENRYYDASGNLESYDLDIYNEKGGHTKTERYNDQEVLEGVSEFDISGNEVKSTQYDQGRVTSYTENSYDDEGYMTESTQYHADGSLSAHTLYQDGRMVKDSYYDESGNLESYTEYVYDENGDHKETTSYHADGSLSYQTLYQDGNQVKSSYYDESGHLDSYTEYTYDNDGNKTEQNSYHADGSLSSQTLYQDGKEIRYNYYDENGNLNSYTEYVYDNEGNKTEQNGYRADGSRNYQMLYQDGKEVKNSSYDENGHLNSYTEYAYDNDGNKTEQNRYRADGSLNTKTLYQDEKRVKYSSYDESGHLDYYTEYTYDSEGNTTEEASYYADGSIKSKTTYKDGDRTETIDYREDGSVEHRSLYVNDDLSKGIWYDEAGNVTNETTY